MEWTFSKKYIVTCKHPSTFRLLPLHQSDIVREFSGKLWFRMSGLTLFELGCVGQVISRANRLRLLATKLWQLALFSCFCCRRDARHFLRG